MTTRAAHPHELASAGRNLRSASHSLARTAASVPLPVAALIASFLAPTEFSLYVADLRLPPHRIALLLLLPFALYKLCTSRTVRVRSFDVAFMAYAASTIAVYGYHHQGDGAVYGGSLALESFGGYIVARVWVRDIETFFATLKFLLACIAAAALIALPDSLLGNTFTHNALQSLTGYQAPRGLETRMGLTRAYGTFDHPIHYGAFCAALFALYWFAEPKAATRLRRAAFLGGATLLSVSAAPLLCVGLQCVMIGWERVTRRTRGRVQITLAALCVLYVLVSLVATRPPLHVLVTSTTFDTWTAYYRLLIWDYGLANVWNNMMLGIGLADWERPEWMVASTVDAFWLVTAMRAGVPVFLMMCLGIALLTRGVVKRSITRAEPEMRRLATGWIVSLIALCLIGATVHYWNVLHTYFFFFVGLGGWFADPKRLKKPNAAAHTAASTWPPAARHRQAPGRAPLGIPARTMAVPAV